MFNEYQQKSCGTFKPATELNAEQVHLLDWAMGLGGDSGEVLDLIKHAIFHKEKTLDKMELAKELGDVLWYVSAIATTCGIDLADVAVLNNAKLAHRYNNGYSTEDSANRHAKETALKDTAIYKCLKARICNTQNAPLNVIVVGPDGSGKTTFTTAICKVLGVTDPVGSPTFAIVNEYMRADGYPMYHFDFYRINKLQEAIEIGLYDYLDSGCLCIMEWPENIEDLLPEETLKVSIKVNPDQSRTVSWEDPLD